VQRFWLLLRRTSIVESSARRVPSQNVSSRVRFPEAIASGGDILSGGIRVLEKLCTH